MNFSPVVRSSHVLHIRAYTHLRSTIHCSSTALYLRPDMLREFVHLESASLSFHAEGRNTQHTSTKLILKNLPPKLTHLTLERLPLVDSYLIGVVAARLPNLRSLKLTCADRLDPDLACCWTCYEESGSHTIHSPMPNFYIGIDDLVVSSHRLLPISSYTALARSFQGSLGPSLEPLCYLEELFLGIYLSDEAIFYDHIIHSEDITQPFAEPYGPDECLICDELHADSVRDTEILASVNIATYLPRLKSISWSSFFAKDLPGDDPDQQRTTIWLKRDGDKIRVRRSKW